MRIKNINRPDIIHILIISFFIILPFIWSDYRYNIIYSDFAPYSKQQINYISSIWNEINFGVNVNYLIDLPLILFFNIVDIIFPLNIVTHLWVSFMLIIGYFPMYLLLKHLDRRYNNFREKDYIYILFACIYTLGIPTLSSVIYPINLIIGILPLAYFTSLKILDLDEIKIIPYIILFNVSVWYIFINVSYAFIIYLVLFFRLLYGIIDFKNSQIIKKIFIKKIVIFLSISILILFPIITYNLINYTNIKSGSILIKETDLVNKVIYNSHNANYLSILTFFGQWFIDAKWEGEPFNAFFYNNNSNPIYKITPLILWTIVIIISIYSKRQEIKFLLGLLLFIIFLSAATNNIYPLKDIWLYLFNKFPLWQTLTTPYDRGIYVEWLILILLSFFSFLWIMERNKQASIVILLLLSIYFIPSILGAGLQSTYQIYIPDYLDRLENHINNESVHINNESVMFHRYMILPYYLDYDSVMNWNEYNLILNPISWKFASNYVLPKDIGLKNTYASSYFYNNLYYTDFSSSSFNKYLNLFGIDRIIYMNDISITNRKFLSEDRRIKMMLSKDYSKIIFGKMTVYNISEKSTIFNILNKNQVDFDYNKLISVDSKRIYDLNINFDSNQKYILSFFDERNNKISDVSFDQNYLNKINLFRNFVNYDFLILPPSDAKYLNVSSNNDDKENVDLKELNITKMNYEKISPTEWHINVKSQKPFIISFAESYDKSWMATINSIDGKPVKLDKIKSKPLFTAINSFSINQTGNLNITIKYENQKLYNFSLVVSMTTFAICIILYKRCTNGKSNRRYENDVF